MKLIVGLGNPGKKYENTRHNIGFMGIEGLKNQYSLPDFSYKSKLNSEISEGNINGEKVVLLKPLTYMNLSGGPVKDMINFYKLSVEDIIVLHDDIDLDFGTVKLKFGGGLAGHNGLKDIDKKIGTKDFWRVRIGVGRPKTKEEVVDYVLSNFSKDEIKELDFIKNDVIDCVEEFLSK